MAGRIAWFPLMDGDATIAIVQSTEMPIVDLGQSVGDWVDSMLDTSPLTDVGRAEVAAAVRRCYGHAGLPWPGRVVWVPSLRAGVRSGR